MTRRESQLGKLSALGKFLVSGDPGDCQKVGDGSLSVDLAARLCFSTNPAKCMS
jgi:hypothetical protein